MWKLYEKSKKDATVFMQGSDKVYKNQSSSFLTEIKAYNWFLLPLVIENKPQGLILVDNKYNQRKKKNRSFRIGRSLIFNQLIFSQYQSIY